MLANDVVRDRLTQAMTALATFYGRQFANTWSPFVGTEGRIPMLSGRLAHQANWICSRRLNIDPVGQFSVGDNISTASTFDLSGWPKASPLEGKARRRHSERSRSVKANMASDDSVGFSLADIQRGLQPYRFVRKLHGVASPLAPRQAADTDCRCVFLNSIGDSRCRSE